MKRFARLPLCLMLACSFVSAQQHENKHYFQFESGFSQVQHDLNFDLVFSGGYLGLGYQREWTTNHGVWNYAADLRFGALQNKGIAFHWQLSPAHLSYAWKVNQLELGPYASLNYMWQQHPQVQGGRVFWLTAAELGISMRYVLRHNQARIKLKAEGSVAGLTSSTSASVEDHYFSLRLSDMIKDSHENFQIHSLQNYQHIKLGAVVTMKETSRVSFGYDFEYYRSSSQTAVKLLYHSLSLHYLINKR